MTGELSLTRCCSVLCHSGYTLQAMALGTVFVFLRSRIWTVPETKPRGTARMDIQNDLSSF